MSGLSFSDLVDDPSTRKKRGVLAEKSETPLAPSKRNTQFLSVERAGKKK